VYVARQVSAAGRSAVLVMVVASIATVLAAASPVSSAPAMRQAVAVAFLEPKTEIDVDVTTGALSVGGFGEPLRQPPEEAGVGLAGIFDPYTRRVFVYRSGGVPGVQEAARNVGPAQVPAAGSPEWRPPAVQEIGAGMTRVVLADGRYATVRYDTQNRVASVAWQRPDGHALTSTITYAPSRTTVRLPFGVLRTYAYDPQGRITGVFAPGAAAHARHDTIAGQLDTSATRHLTDKRLPLFGHAEHSIIQAAGETLGTIYQDEAENGGFEIFSVDSLAAALRVNRTIMRLGLLDVAQAVPERASFRDVNREVSLLHPLFKLLAGCNVSTEVRLGGGVEVSIARTITAPEVLQLDKLVSTVPDWVYIIYGRSTECATLL
jgi:YD repeat-containing protein